MDDPQIVARDQWLVARKELLTKKQLTRQRDAVAAERRRLPMVEIDKEYVFDGRAGKVSLLDLFEGRSQLLVYHFMWLFDEGQGCPSCSFLVDNIGHLSHLHARDTTSSSPAGRSTRATASGSGWGGPCRGTRRTGQTSISSRERLNP